MQIELSFDTLWHLAITLGLGLVVGLERERAGKEVGLRTFSFTALLGFLTWNLGPAFALSTLAFLCVLVIIINVRAIQKGAGVEATTSVALFVVAVVGMMVAQGILLTPVAVIILMLALLSWKEEMVLFSQHLQRHEIHAAITLGILSFVILPVLPDGPLDRWGLFDLRKIWLMVVLISAIGFANYVVLKLYGPKGINYTGFLGGLVNSRATVAELAERARVDAAIESSAFRAIMWAQAAAFLRNGLTLALFAPAALPAGIVPVGMMLLITIAFGLRSHRETYREEPPEIKIQSPFSLRSALIFGLYFAVITVFSGIAGQLLGDLGFYVVAFFGGVVSSASTAATAAHLVTSGRIEPVVAGSAVVISSIASALATLPVVWKGSDKPLLARRVATALGWAVVGSAVGILVNPLFLRQYHAVEAWIAR